MKWLFLLLILFSNKLLFSQTETNVIFQHAGKIVHGTFSTPASEGPYPTVIIMPGSGPNDRNGTSLLSGPVVECLYPDLNGETITPYKDLAEGLVEVGFAVLRYDKLEFTYTPATLGTITFNKLWLPVESAIAYLKTRDDVNTSKITLLGHSEGSSIIPYIARRNPDICSMISVAGPRTPFDSIFAYQQVHFSQLCGLDTTAAQTLAEQILQYFDAIRSGNVSGPPVFGVPAAVWGDYLEVIDSVSINYNLANVPTLFVGLELDYNVPLSELERFRNEVTISDDFWEIPGLIHYMNPLTDPHVSDVVIDTIVHWLKEQCFTSGLESYSLEDRGFQIYPTLTTDQLTVNNDLITEYTIEVMDSAGLSVLKKSVYNNTSFPLNVSHLAPGIYFLRILHDKKYYTGRFVKN